MMNLELANNLNQLKEIVNCDLAIEYGDKKIATNYEIAYQNVYEFKSYKLLTSQVMNSQLLELINFYFENYFEKINNYSQYFNDIIDGKISEFSYIKIQKKRLVLIITTNPFEAFETLKNFIDVNDYIFIRNGQELILLVSETNIEEYVNNIKNFIDSELMIKSRIAYSSYFYKTDKIKDSYFECKDLLSLGNIFRNNSNIYTVDKQIIERLVYSTSVVQQAKFLSKYPGISDINNEDINTINKLLENNLNIAQTSRAMYIHRNTLLYRIDKILSKIGLNVLVFNDAMTLKLLLIIDNINKFENN